ncbi:hypothetical protein AB1Y20_011222 [Prymnesium parvum]|uniref:ATP-dependent transporter ycf16 n=1 Tax=Prymnesium parvum TaxID=97485 RepID=A0AB34INP1_PRYPA
MLLTEWRLALLALVLRAPLLARLAVVAGRVVGLYGVAQQRALNAANALAAEALAQAQTVVAHAAVRSVLDEYDGRVREYMRVIQCTLVSETALRFTRLAIDSLATWLMLAAGLHAVLHHRLTLGALTAFYTYSDVFARGCTSAQEVVSTLCTMRPACARYFELLDRSPAMAWGVGATPDRCEGALEVRNVSFAYAGRREGALHGVSFRVPAGTSLAIVGPSGAGKSSLLKLLLRLYDPDEGQVLLDGVDLRCLELGWMRSRFGYVPQQPLLFDATIAENVCFGEPGTVDEESVAAACAAAFVARLPDGVRTRVGEGGKHLSGGQRQRIAIARALVRRPRVLLWDEATSSLDGESERAVQATMQAALRDGHAGWRCSAVVVAHRLSSVLCADMVLVLREGRVEEFGSPSELSHAGGWFEQNFFGASRDHQGATGQEV